jgi:hypothetical protein
MPGWMRSAAPRVPGAADIVITLAFLAAMIANLAHHAMWRDELNAWGIVVASPTLANLFHNMHYEGHPALWHGLLWLASAVSTAPQTMQVVHGIIGAGLVLLIGLASPFSRLERVLLLAGYFLAFEFTVVSRNYGICLLLALLYAHTRSATPRLLWRNAVLLALLANTTVWGTILSGALALDYLIDRVLDGRRQGGIRYAPLAGAAAVYLAGAAVAVATMMPAADIGVQPTHPFDLALSFGHLLRTMLRFVEVPFLPIRPSLLAPHFWPEPREQDSVAALWRLLLLLPFACLVIAGLFRRDPMLLLIVGLTLIGCVVFGHVVFSNGIRHWGISFVVVIACLWMQRMRRPGASWLVLAMLLAGAVGGVQAIAAEWRQPYSQAEATAIWIRQHQLQDLPLVGFQDFKAIAVAQYLQRPMTMPECACTATYLRFSRDREGFDPAHLPEALAAIARAHPGQDLLYVGSAALTQPEGDALTQAALQVTPLSKHVGSRMQEDFYLYRIAHQPGP